MTATMTRRPFTANEFHRMVDVGILPEHGVALVGEVVMARPVGGELPRPHHFTIDEYEALLPAGILTEDERVELIRGEIVEMMTSGRRHERCVNQLTLLCVRAISAGLFVGVQNPVRIPNNSAPEPDIAIIRDHGPDSPPISDADALFVLEVSDSTLAYDRDEKLLLYAEAGIPEAWIVDIAAGAITRYTEPQDGLYRQSVTAREGDTLPSTTVSGLVIPVADVLH